MVRIQSWVTSTRETLGEHRVVHMVVAKDATDVGVTWAASVVPRQYASAKRIASVLANLGKPEAAAYLENKLPMSTRARSGDLGEIIGAQYAARELGHRTIARLRWKDHREMAMRGDDIIGVRVGETGEVEFLKGEVKSRAYLGAATVGEADAALQRDHGRPSPHALEFIADRLHEQGEDVLAARIDRALLLKRIAQRQVLQLLFVFTGNNSSNLLRSNTESYKGPIRRRAVGLQVSKHQEFVAAVYSKVISDARNR